MRAVSDNSDVELRTDGESRSKKQNPWGMVGPHLHEEPPDGHVPKKGHATPEMTAYLAARRLNAEGKESDLEQFSISLDRGAIRNIISLLSPEEGVDSLPSRVRDEVARERSLFEEEQRIFFDTLARLPETLSFRQGITLIVGENGSGKTTLAKSILLALECKGRQGQLRLDAAFANDREGFENAERDAMKMTFNPTQPTDVVWLAQAGYAQQLGRAISINGNFGDDSFLGKSAYNEVPAILGEGQSGEYSYFARSENVGRTPTQGFGHHRSHRQTVDRILAMTLQEQRDAAGKTPVFFLDEPETGVGPRRHLKLEDELKTMIDDDAYAIIVTNSPILFQSNLPRIDMDQPERGIFAPNDTSSL